MNSETKELKFNEEAEKKAREFYWKRNPHLTIAPNTRPDMVVGYYQGYIDAIENYHKTEWVSVEDDLPPIDSKYGHNAKAGLSDVVFVHLDFNTIRKARYYHNGEHSFWSVDGYTASGALTITHWMPLPTPPKQD